MSKNFQVIEILNPFDPRDNVSSDREWVAGKSVADYFPAVVYKSEIIIALNGKMVEGEDKSRCYPQPGDCLMVYPIVLGGGGGDGGKTVLRIAAMIALSIAAAPAGAALAGAALAGTAATAATIATVGAVIQAGIMMAGGMLINALIPPPKPDVAKSEQTYGIDSAKNTAVEGVPVPVVYGKIRFAGNVINNYVTNDGDAQWLHMLVNCGEGELDNITDIELNDQPLSEFRDVWTMTRMGVSEQALIPYFEGTTTPYPIGHRLTQDWHTYTTKGEVDRLRLDFSAPSGLIGKHKKDDVDVTVPVIVQIRRSGTLDWGDMTGGTTETSYVYTNTWLEVVTAGEFTGGGSNDGDSGPGVPGLPGLARHVPTGTEYLIGDDWHAPHPGGSSDAGGADIKVGYRSATGTVSARRFSMTGKSRNPQRRSYMSDPLPEGAYDVRVCRANPEGNKTDQTENDIVIWTDANEIVDEKVSHAHSALLAIRVRASDQLSGVPTVTHLSHGRRIYTFNEDKKEWDYGPSSNPAWISLDILTNRRFGGGHSRGRFNLTAWRKWAKFCDDKKLEFNGVFSSKGNVWDAVMQVMRCGRAQLVRVGTRYTVAVEAPAGPVMMFSAGNIIQGSFSETWMGTADRINVIEAKFQDRDARYEERTLRVADRDALARGAPERVTSVELKGVTSEQQAWDDLNILLNINRYIQRTIQFDAPTDAIACSVGDVILFQHDMPAWGEGGRTADALSTSTIKLDKPVTMEEGKTYSLLLHYAAIKRYEGTVAAVVNSSIETTLLLWGFDARLRVDRIKINGKELQVRDIVSSNGSLGVEVDSIEGFAAGQLYELWAVDAIETRGVVNLAVAGTPLIAEQVTAVTPFPDAPPLFTVYMFGENAKVAKPFRVKSVSGSHDYERTIIALEYNATVYDPAGASPTPNYSSLTSAVKHVTISGVSEITAADGRTTVSVSFDSAQQTYRKGRVSVSRSGGPFEAVGEDIYGMTIAASRGEKVTFRIVAVDTFGRVAPESGAPTMLYTVKGSNPIATPGGIALSVLRDEVRRFEWRYPSGPESVGLAGFEARYFAGYGVPRWADMTPLFEASAIERSREVTLPPAGGTVVAIRAKNIFDEVGTEGRTYFYIRGTASADDPRPIPILLPAPNEGASAGSITILLPSADPGKPGQLVTLLLPAKDSPKQPVLMILLPTTGGSVRHPTTGLLLPVLNGRVYDTVSGLLLPVVNGSVAFPSSTLLLPTTGGSVRHPTTGLLLPVVDGHVRDTVSGLLLPVVNGSVAFPSVILTPVFGSEVSGATVRLLLPNADARYPTGVVTILLPRAEGSPQRGYSLLLPPLDREKLNVPITILLPILGTSGAPIIPGPLTPGVESNGFIAGTILASPTDAVTSSGSISILLPILDLVQELPVDRQPTGPTDERLITEIEAVDADGLVKFSVPGVADPTVVGYQLRKGVSFEGGPTMTTQQGKAFAIPTLDASGEVLWVAGMYSNGGITARRWKLDLTAIAAAAPRGLAWRVAEPEIVFSWDVLPGALKYRAYLESGGITQVRELYSPEVRFSIPRFSAFVRVVGVSATGNLSAFAEEEMSISGSYNYNELYTANIDVPRGKFANLAFVNGTTVRRVSVKGSDAVAPYVQSINDSDLFAFVRNLKSVPVNSVAATPLNWFRSDFWKNKSGFFESPVTDFGKILSGKLILSITKSVTAAGPTPIKNFKDVAIGHISDSSVPELSDQRALVSAKFLASEDAINWKEVGYGDWVTARYVQAVVAVEMASPLTEVTISAGKFMIDVPDISESGNMLALTSSGKVLVFSKKYSQVSAVLVTARGPARATTRNLTPTSVEIVTDSATPTTVDYFVKGY